MSKWLGFHIKELKELIKDLPDEMPVMLMTDFESSRAQPIQGKGQIFVQEMYEHTYNSHPYREFLTENIDEISEKSPVLVTALVISNC